MHGLNENINMNMYVSEPKWLRGMLSHNAKLFV